MTRPSSIGTASPCAIGRTSLRRLAGTAVHLAAVVASTAPCAAAAGEPGPALRIVRVGHGNVAPMHDTLQVSVDACRLAKHLPMGAAALPSDAVLGRLALVEQEELFDGQHWAQDNTQRQVAADGSDGCRLAVFIHRDVDVETTCATRTSSATPLLGELMEVEAPSPASPTVFDTPLPAAEGSRAPPHAIDIHGLPREDAGGAACVWNSAMVGRKLAALAASLHRPAPSAAPAGHDICLDADRPTCVFQGHGRPVVLATRTTRREADADVADLIGETAAFGNLTLSSFSTSASIAPERFTRGAIDRFLRLPSKTAVPDH